MYAEAAIMAGEPIAAWGDVGPLMHSEGFLWLFTSSAIERIPVSFFRQARRVIAERLEVRSRLRTSVLASSSRSVRFWRMLDFTIDPPDERGLSEIWIERG
jgi:hypothetical protein